VWGRLSSLPGLALWRGRLESPPHSKKGTCPTKTVCFLDAQTPPLARPEPPRIDTPKPPEKPAGSGDSDFQRLLSRAEQGDADAQFNLGVSYRDGEGVAKDGKQATEWFRKAAQRGNKDAEKALRDMRVDLK
jgi:hypothetical protein